MTRPKRKARLKPSAEPSAGPIADPWQLYDLKLHQAELETQNRELHDVNDELRAALHRYAELFDLAPIGYCALDRAGRVQNANLTAATMLGTDRGWLINRPLSALIASNSREAFRQHFRGCLEHQRPAVSELFFKVRNRGDLAMHVVSTPTFGQGGVDGCKTTLTDVSELKRTQELLSLLSSAGEILGASFDYEATLARMARRAIPLLGDVCYVDLWRSDRSLERLTIALAPRLEQHGSFLRRKNASTQRLLQTMVFDSGGSIFRARLEPAEIGEIERHCRLVSEICAPLRGTTRTFGTLTVGVADDGRSYDARELQITEELARRMAVAVENAEHYDDARQAVDTREKVLDLVSHELKSPLHVMRLATEALGHDATPKDRNNALDAIRRAVARMDRMVGDLLDFSSIEAGRLNVEQHAHGVRSLLDDAAEAMTPLATAKGVTLTFDSGEAEWHVLCDGQRMLQVFSNLIGNAIKFTPAGGAITVGVNTSGGSEQHTLFFVRDTGPGVPEEQRQQLFDRFWQAEETAHQGRGLGLYITRGLIEAMGGSIWCESELGAGTTFRFTVPSAPD